MKKPPNAAGSVMCVWGGWGTLGGHESLKMQRKEAYEEKVGRVHLKGWPTSQFVPQPARNVPSKSLRSLGKQHEHSLDKQQRQMFWAEWCGENFSQGERGWDRA